MNALDRLWARLEKRRRLLLATVLVVVALVVLRAPTQVFGRARYVIVPGLVILLGPYVWKRRELIGDWVVVARGRYLTFLALVAAMIPAAGVLRSTPAVLVLLVLLAWAGSRLNDVVREDRRLSAAGQRRDHGPARMLLALVQLVCAVLLVVVGIEFAGEGWDGLFYLGVALIVMSLGAFVSELRQNRRHRGLRGPILLVASLLSLAAATTVAPESSIALIVAGALLGQIGMELASEDYQRWDEPVPGWIVGGSGLLVLVTALALFAVAGADPGHVLPLVGVVAIIVFFSSADGDALIIVFVVAVALVWATSPVGQQPDPDLVAAESQPYFVVFGDSYISGEGAEQFIPGTNEKVGDPGDDDDHTNECRQAPTAWPFVVAGMAAAGEIGVPSRVLFLACSGAVTENIHTEPRLAVDVEGGEVRHGPAELALFRAERERIGRAPEFAVISIGGNDAGFGDIGQTCVGPGSCAEVGEQFLRSDTRVDRSQPVEGRPGKGRPEALAHISDDLDAAYQRVRAAVGPEVPVLAVPYPVPLTETGRCRGVLLDDDERRFIRGFVEQLNLVVESAARRNGLLYMDTMEDALRRQGAQLCSSVAGRSGLNFLALNPTSGSIVDSLSPQNWLHNSLHPNANGHEALAETARDWLADNSPFEPGEPEDAEPHEVASITDVLGGSVVPQCDPSDRPSCRVDGGVWRNEQAHTYFSTHLFPFLVAVAGLWLVMAPLLRWGRRHEERVSVVWLITVGSRRVVRRGRLALGWLWSGD